ncbi:MAG: signal peptidase II, partial [Deltaproteobacteria bacterium]|nr:signal peptidase II [Deltaproteobacteria bacterium]
ALLGFDLGSKAYFSQKLRLGESIDVIKGLFSFTLVHNKGAAFGIGSDWSTPFFLGTTFAAMAVVIYLFKTIKSHEVLSRWGLVMILSGALGNVIDRLRLGYVIDFLDVYYQSHHWPVFNIADSAITIGAILFALDSFLQTHPIKTKADRAESQELPTVQ